MHKKKKNQLRNGIKKRNKINFFFLCPIFSFPHTFALSAAAVNMLEANDYEKNFIDAAVCCSFVL